MMASGSSRISTAERLTRVERRVGNLEEHFDPDDGVIWRMFATVNRIEGKLTKNGKMPWWGKLIALAMILVGAAMGLQAAGWLPGLG